MIKLLVLNCVSICCMYGDTIQTEMAVLCLLVSLSPYIEHMNTHFSTSNFIIFFYILTHILQLLSKTEHFKSVNCFYVLRNTPFKEHLPEDSQNTWWKHVGG